MSERALIGRINRTLNHDEQVLRKSRGARAQFDLGDYYIVNWRINGIVEDHVDLEDLGRELIVLEPYEKLT